MSKSARLAWRKADFVAAKEEIPQSLYFDTLHTEGELMSRDDIDGWLADTAATFCIVREADQKRFDELFSEYLADLDYLKSLGKITETEAVQLANPELYKFGTEEQNDH